MPHVLAALGMTLCRLVLLMENMDFYVGRAPLPEAPDVCSAFSGGKTGSSTKLGKRLANIMSRSRLSASIVPGTTWDFDSKQLCGAAGGVKGLHLGVPREGTEA